MKHLRYFDALARTQHFGRAAEACSVTQPALSVQIKELEAMLGTTLVERTSRSIRLTALGEDFAQRVREILLSVDELGDLVRASSGPLVGRLRVGVIPTIAPYMLPKVIKVLIERYPSLDIEPREAITTRLIEDLKESRLDMALLALPISEPDLREFSLFDEEFVLVRPISEGNLPVPNAAGLEKMRLLLLEEGHCFRDQALSFCHTGSAWPRNLMEASSLSTLVQMVSVGIGVTLIPEMAVPFETRLANVSVATFTGVKPSRSIGLVWRKSSPLVDQLMTIGSLIRTIGKP